MLLSDFYNEFLVNYDNKKLSASANALMKSMGEIATFNRGDFIDLLTESGIYADYDNMSDVQLIDMYVDNLSENRTLRLGTAMLIGMKNKQSGFDGEDIISDPSIKAAYHTLCVFFRSPSDNYYSFEGKSYAGGADPISAIASAIGEGAKFGSKLSDAQQKKKYGASDAADRKAQAKQAMTQQILANKQAEQAAKQAKADSNAKLTKTVVIASSVIVGLGIVGFVMWKVLKK